MVRHLLAGAFCALVLAAPVAAEEAAAPNAAAPAAAAPPGGHPDDMVCKNQVVLGSHFKKRVCMRRAEWAARSAADRKDLENIQNNNGGVPPGMGGG